MTAGSPGQAVVVLGLIGLFLGGVADRSQGQQRPELRQFMRQKLEHSQNVLEGLALEDYRLIADNAKAMRELSEDAQWRVSPHVRYIRLSQDFQQLADELAEQAAARNLDGATLSYLKLTINCIECHKLVRDERLITRRSPETESHAGLRND